MPRIPDRTNSAQAAFLDWMMTSGVVLDVFMNQGAHMVGVIGYHDEFTVLLYSPNRKKTRLLFKAQVALLRPKETPSGKMDRPIRHKRRKRYYPMEHFRHPFSID